MVNKKIHEELADIISRVRDISNVYCDPRVQSIIITRLEEAQLWAAKLMKEP